jgi:phosphatidylglycerophosphate synthase
MKTVFQMVAIPAVMLNDWPFSYFDSSWGVWRISLILVYLATAMSLISGIIYVVQNRKVLVEAKHE